MFSSVFVKHLESDTCNSKAQEKVNNNDNNTSFEVCCKVDIRSSVESLVEQYSTEYYTVSDLSLFCAPERQR